MINDTDLPQQPDIIQQQSSHLFNSLKQFILITAILLPALVAGVSRYLLGIKTNQNAPLSTQSISLQPSPTPTIKPSLTPFAPETLDSILTIVPADPEQVANWKTYINTQWGVSFKYPETWFPQAVPNWTPPGDEVQFYQNGVTPHPGEAGDPTNAVFAVNNQEGHSPQTNEQFISKARQTDGHRALNIAGKPAIRGDGYRGEWYYEIKLSSTRWLIFVVYNDDGAKRLDTIVSTIKFTNE